MSIEISGNHPTFQLKNKVTEISGNFLKQYGFNYFQYLRCFSDGSAGLLTSHTGLFGLFSAAPKGPVIFSSYQEEHEKMHSYWFLWDEELPEMPVSLAREQFNFNNGLTLVRRSKNYYDMIAVALPKMVENAASFYLNKLGAIENFINYFDTNHRDLISVMSDSPLVLPPDYRDINYDKICLKNSKFTVHGINGPTHITAQELSVLRLLAQGFSYKEIARHINLSPRTVETYLTRIKDRTGYTSSKSLEALLLTCK